MKTKPLDNAKLGLFVIAGALFLIFSLYMIGRNRNIFGSTVTIKSSFHNVNGLTPGSNVRFAGIDVGTVRSVELGTDTSIMVTMVIDKKTRPYIKKNSIASVGTDGLMGNKLININAIASPSRSIEDNDTIQSLKPVETAEMLRTLNTTNDNIELITHDLRKITQKINNSNSLWTLLSDTTITRDLKQAAVNVKLAGLNAARAGNEIIDLAQTVKQGRGLAGTLIMDTVMVNQLKSSMNDIRDFSVQTSASAKELREVLETIKQGEGMAGALLADTSLVKKLNQTMGNIEQGTERFNENMKAMREHFLFKGYFKKMDRQNK